MVKIKKTLVFILVVAFLLRTYHLSTDLLFHRDQGLHSLSIWNIWHQGKLSLLGHPSDVDGLIHAPIYYWLMLPAYALSAGNPVMASLFQISLEILSLPFLFLAVKKLFNSRTAWLTLLIYAISYGGVSLSRWLVNVTPVLALTNFLLFFLTHYPKVFLTSIIVGIITQLNAAIGTFFLPFLFWFHRSRLTLKKIFTILTGFLLPALPLIVFELRHQLVISKAVLNFSGQDVGINPGVFITNLSVLFTEINKIISYPHIYISSILFLLGLFEVRNLKHSSFILAFLFIPFIGLSLFQRGAIGFFLVSLLPVALAISMYGLQFLPLKYFILAGLIYINIVNLSNVYQPNNALTPIGNANIITIQDRKNIIDFMYQQANGQDFAVWFYTIPYFQEEVWDYMFLYYAKPKYGYLPESTAGFSPGDLKTSKVFFSIWEPDENQPAKLDSWQKETVNNFGSAIKSYSTHDLYINLHYIR